MIALDELLIRSYEPGVMNLHWTLENTDEDSSVYTVNIYRGFWAAHSGIIDEFDLVSSGVISADDYGWTDTTISGYEYDQWQELYYALSFTDGSNTGDICNPVKQASYGDIYSDAIIRTEDIAFRLTGRPCAIFKKKTSGTRCPDYDVTIGRHQTANCSTCYDTGYQGGYYTPIIRTCMINPTPKRQAQLQWGEWQITDAILTSPPWPDVEPGDVVVSYDNKRYEILEVRPTQKGLVTVINNSRMEIIPKGDIRYRLSVPDLVEYVR